MFNIEPRVERTGQGIPRDRFGWPLGALSFESLALKRQGTLVAIGDSEAPIVRIDTENEISHRGRNSCNIITKATNGAGRKKRERDQPRLRQRTVMLDA